MQAVKLSFAELLKIEGNIEHYHIPKYQREYVWGRFHWETLLNDINENNFDYFIGSVIVVGNSTELRPGEEKIYQVIDGQQRLTTLSIFLAAIYSKYSTWSKVVEDEDTKNEYTIKLDSIKRKLLKKKKEIYPNELGGFKNDNFHYFLRVQPSTQNLNLADYKFILKICGLLANVEVPKFFGLRRFSKAFEFFSSQLPNTKEELDTLLDKINRLVFIHISVSTQADAFTLFETLNNRGLDLSPIDIIKNSLLAEMEKQHGQEIDTSYDNWQLLLQYLPDFDNQSRFLRQFYNAFKVDEKIKQERITRATKSNILQIYESLIKKNAKFTFEELLAKGEFYGKLIGTVSSENADFNLKITELNRVGAATSYTLLLYLLTNESKFEAGTSMNQIIDFLIKYYVRRNITDTPNTRDLDAVTIEVIEKCNALLTENKRIDIETIREGHINNSKAKPASLAEFKKWLSDKVYTNNVGMTRYLLWKLDSVRHTKEYSPDLWQRNPNNDTFVWTIEHIFPEGENIPPSWVDMIGGGEMAKASEIQAELVHILGNLTLSAYNSNLSNRSFLDKQMLSTRKVGKDELSIGYKNGLSLNNLTFILDNKEFSLSTIEKWNVDSIEARTKSMVDKLISIFRFENEVIA
jgi:uncharacterized protein with ParB-like and HNH nuclease domain